MDKQIVKIVQTKELISSRSWDYVGRFFPFLLLLAIVFRHLLRRSEEQRRKLERNTVT